MKYLHLIAFVLLGGMAHAGTVRDITNEFGKTIKVELITKTDLTVTFKLPGSSKTYTVDRASLSQSDQDFLQDWEPEAAAVETPKEEAEVAPSSRLYPKSKEEIRSTVREILGRKATNGARKEQDAVNLLNVYRYLCGVPYNVTQDSQLNSHSEAAAKICKEKGQLSHDFGHYTDKCNLFSGGDMVHSVEAYIDDSGDNNRERRGHRRWCLNPGMEKTGFGTGGSAYSAMWSMDGAFRKTRHKRWSYPGEGFYPREYMHGTGWSLYLDEAAPEKDRLTITIHKLRKRPEKPISFSQEPDGKDIGVRYIYTYNNTINFEPADFSAGDRGIYCVTVKGGGVRERYIVEFF
ncbi:hypothetical protein SAMN02745181_0790 [Rubritalea squalenifaciens DSM 18772]|uniref:Cysteine-rich secretory protein family protein n=1 Tax=Rubritalea squalenifaciens DSM 18772 TaxID=1123071 RepID=A0A1M6DN27_9BACT|nr:CAP domain-containing protein [Rubritalea squalenifaciens]SHI74694.1 hypothetical protein SAMN02745181_0790 [Rubritalea squalenifaciens DSM 18772]